MLHLALADFANDEGECWPSRATLARKARCSEVWTRTAIKQLKEEGWLEIVSYGNGRGNRSQYRLLNKGVTTKTLLEEGESAAPERGNAGAIPSILSNRKEPLNGDVDFEAFWSAYPKKVAKLEAKRVFQKIMKRPDAPALPVLILAAEAYAGTVADPKYLAHPTTWLRQERWADQLESAKVTSPTKSVPPHIAAAQSAGAAFRISGGTEDDVMSAFGNRPEELAAALEMFKWKK